MTDGMRVTTKVTLEGNFFHRDPGKTFRQNVRDMNDALASWMEAEVRGQVEGRSGSMPHYTGWTADHIVGRTESLSGNRWGTWAVVSANTAGMDAKDAIRTKAAAAGIERRWHPFRQVKSAIYRARPLLRADLTKGLE
jgi:hypothetical protein